MVPWRSTDEGYVTPEVLDWYGRFAEGEPGVLVVEATGIRDVRSGPLLRISGDQFIPGLARLVDTVAKRSRGNTRLILQILDFLPIRRRPEARRYFLEFWSPNSGHRERFAEATGRPPPKEEAFREAVFDLGAETWVEILTPREWEDLMFGHRVRVTDMELPEVAALPETLPTLFSDAAERADRAGFHGVELHFAHAYTMASFLSARNSREDGYGGDLEGRLRLPLRVLSAVRRRLGERIVVGIRYLAEEMIDGGYGVESAVVMAEAFARAGVDYLSLSRGGKFEDARRPKVGAAAYPYTGPSGHECMPTVRIPGGPFGRNVTASEAVRRALRQRGFHTPVVVAGGLCEFDQVEDILRSGKADFIASARQSLADPDWWRKMRLGVGATVRRCLFTNYCEGLDQAHKEVTCQLWDRVQPLAANEGRSRDGRRRLVAPAWTPEVQQVLRSEDAGGCK